MNADVSSRLVNSKAKIGAVVLTALFLTILISVLAKVGNKPGALGIADGRLEPCPPKRNCVSSDDTNSRYRIDPLPFGGSAENAWLRIAKLLEAMPRTSIVEQTSEYIRAEVRIPVFGFVDDLELHLRPDEKQIAVRSASRAGEWDLGINRRRVEELRRQFVN